MAIIKQTESSKLAKKHQATSAKWKAPMLAKDSVQEFASPPGCTTTTSDCLPITNFRSDSPPLCIERLCLNTAKVLDTYSSSLDAAEQTGIPHCTISKCLSRKARSAGGYFFRFAGADDDIPQPKIRKRNRSKHVKKKNMFNRKRVAKINPNSGAIIATFDSIREAAEAARVTGASIGNVCHGRSKTSGGFGWRLLDSDDDDPRTASLPVLLATPGKQQADSQADDLSVPTFRVLERSNRHQHHKPPSSMKPADPNQQQVQTSTKPANLYQRRIQSSTKSANLYQQQMQTSSKSANLFQRQMQTSSKSPASPLDSLANAASMKPPVHQIPYHPRPSAIKYPQHSYSSPPQHSAFERPVPLRPLPPFQPMFYQEPTYNYDPSVALAVSLARSASLKRRVLELALQQDGGYFDSI